MALSAGLFLFSCSENKPAEIVDFSEWKQKGDSIATISQKALLEKVSKAIEKGGTEYAVDFCNVEAMPLTDSLSNSLDVRISRISDKNRNPENELNSETDREIFKKFAENNSVKDSLFNEDEQLVYYKRINLTMPACIKCHGNPKIDIEPNTFEKIKSNYPDDKAIGYAMGDFRGLWKIEFRNN